MTKALIAAVALMSYPFASAQPVFRSRVNLVLVDIRVVSGDEQVKDLRPDELTLLIDGVPRRIVSLQYYDSEQGRPKDR